ncbi:Alpha/Beta hydrolase protein [Pseudoneurospora amorphoporcata]|uniref:Carboxylic ester hydrolase n=1 Tax=Pseudoneurospora amorphoporcata TaxID=241081 RepID=A0AAN6SEE1_9PEZI|nr:Alpha/Beta hydrolase protein [Pseudoneurospora amorphoporcata]
MRAVFVFAFEVLPTIILLLASTAACVQIAVNVTYSEYVGTQLGSGVSQWLGLRYAAPPVGALRFAPPQDPPFNSVPQAANKHRNWCVRRPVSLTWEDCLFLDVYAPTNATTDSKLPVFVFIQGGGFNDNANPNLNGTGLVKASSNSIVVVTLNYRVGPYGFLANRQQSVANNGLRDQRKALEWVQKYISQFGGNPNHVVLGGASAGAASVAYHMMADKDGNRKLFHAAAVESVSFGTVLTVDQAHYQYDNLVNRLGCASSDSAASIACLRSKSQKEIADKDSDIPYPGSSTRPIYMWSPVIDGDFVTDYPYSAFQNGKFTRNMPVIFGDDTNGGAGFAPSRISSLRDSNQFIKDNFPAITLAQLDTLNKLYPNPHASTCPSMGCWRGQAGNVYGEMRYMCPGLYLNDAFDNYNDHYQKGTSSWAYRWNVEDKDQMAAGLGVPHIVELNALFGPTNMYYTGQVPKSYWPGMTNAAAVQVIQGYWVSFIKTFDPNTLRWGGSAEWKAWKSGKGGSERHQRLLFGTGGKTAMEEISRGSGLAVRCAYLQSIGTSLWQ